MKTLEEIKQMAEEFTSENNGHYHYRGKECFIKGYVQCQEDMTEIMLIFEEIWEQMNGKTDDSGDMIYVPPILRQKIKQTKLI